MSDHLLARASLRGIDGLPGERGQARSLAYQRHHLRRWRGWSRSTRDE